MIGIIVVTHGNFGKELIASFNMIAGEQEKMVALSLLDGVDIADFEEDVSRSAYELDDGDGVIILADVFGGSPSNCASRLLMKEDISIEIVTGVNLPMLIRVTESRNNTNIKQLANVAVSAVVEYSLDVRKYLQSLTDS